MKAESLAEAILLILEHSPQRVHVIWRFGLTFPIVVVLWYTFGGIAFEGPSVALVALLLIFSYGAGMSFLTARALVDFPHHDKRRSSKGTTDFGEAIARRIERQRHSNASVGNLDLQEDDTPAGEEQHPGDRESLFPLRG